MSLTDKVEEIRNKLSKRITELKMPLEKEAVEYTNKILPGNENEEFRERLVELMVNPLGMQYDVFVEQIFEPDKITKKQFEKIEDTHYLSYAIETLDDPYFLLRSLEDDETKLSRLKLGRITKEDVNLSLKRHYGTLSPERIEDVQIPEKTKKCFEALKNAEKIDFNLYDWLVEFRKKKIGEYEAIARNKTD